VEEVRGECRELRNGERHDLYFSLNIFRAIYQGGWDYRVCGKSGENRNSYRFLVVKPEERTN
jgi:hypothetical protein